MNARGPAKKQFCAHGHDTELCGRYKNSTCRECAKKRYASTASIKNWHYKSHFGITLDQYNLIFAEQNGLCLGCYKHQTACKRSLCVDHDHKTGKVRGLLCHECNSVLGYTKDNPVVLRRLADYLEVQGAL